MPRYMIERTFPNGLAIPPNAQGAEACMTVVATTPSGGHLGALLRLGRQEEDVLRLRRAVAGGDPRGVAA